MDLEGIVAKLRATTCDLEGSWINAKNPRYTQAIGRHERFDALRANRKRWAKI